MTVVMAFAVCASLANAELTARGDLFVKFSGGIAPDALPRDSRAPISVSVVGTIRTLSGERPPALREISIAINQGGQIDAVGLPVCHRGQIEPSSTAEALATLRLGAGRPRQLRRRRRLPGTVGVPLARPDPRLQRRSNGKRAILAHVYGGKPVPITRIIVFRIHESRGTFGTILTGRLPATLNRCGYLKQISLEPAPQLHLPGEAAQLPQCRLRRARRFPGATFPFAHASMTFADGRTLSSTLTRSCKVRAPM